MFTCSIVLNFNLLMYMEKTLFFLDLVHRLSNTVGMCNLYLHSITYYKFLLSKSSYTLFKIHLKMIRCSVKLSLIAK